jgi:YaiO family outer membrane protein
MNLARVGVCLTLCLPWATLAAQPLPLRLELGSSHESASAGAAWRQTDAALRWDFAARSVAEATWRSVRRFGHTDVEYGALLAWQLQAGWGATVAATRSADALLLPRSSVRAELTHELGHGVVLGASVQQRRYATLESRAAGLNLEHYSAAGRLAASAITTAIDGAPRSAAWRVQFDRDLGPGRRLGLLVAKGREVEGNGVGVFAAQRVESYRLLGRWPLSAHWALNGDFGTQRQGDAPRRSGGRIGVEYLYQ